MSTAAGRHGLVCSSMVSAVWMAAIRPAERLLYVRREAHERTVRGVAGLTCLSASTVGSAAPHIADEPGADVNHTRGRSAGTRRATRPSPYG